MSVGLMCDCPLPPLKGLLPADRGHEARLDGQNGCPNYAEDQARGGLCRFCADAMMLRVHIDRREPHDA